MREINKYIFMICPFCGKMGIVKRSKEDPKEAIWCKNPCGCNSEKVEGINYYFESGFIDLFQRGTNSQLCYFCKEYGEVKFIKVSPKKDKPTCLTCYEAMKSLPINQYET